MKLKFWELKLDGTKYKDNNGYVWVYNDISKRFTFTNKDFSTLMAFYNHEQLIQDITFEEFVGWSKVPIDTKILVGCIGYVVDTYKRHFAGIDEDTGKILAWNDGQTSFTTNKATVWDFAELYKEEEGE